MQLLSRASLLFIASLVRSTSATTLTSLESDTAPPSPYASTIAPECATQTSIKCCAATDEAACWQTACDMPSRFVVRASESAPAVGSCWQVRPEPTTSTSHEVPTGSQETSTKAHASSSYQAPGSSDQTDSEEVIATTTELDIDGWAASMSSFAAALSSMKYTQTPSSEAGHTSTTSDYSASSQSSTSTHSSTTSQSSIDTSQSSSTASCSSDIGAHHPPTTLHPSSTARQTTPTPTQNQAKAVTSLTTITTTSSGQPMVLVYEYVNKQVDSNGTNAFKGSSDRTSSSDSSVWYSNSTIPSPSSVDGSTYAPEGASASPITIVAPVVSSAQETVSSDTSLEGPDDSHQQPTRPQKYHESTASNASSEESTTLTSTITTTIKVTVTATIGSVTSDSAQRGSAPSVLSPTNTTASSLPGSTSLTRSPSSLQTSVQASPASPAAPSSASPSIVSGSSSPILRPPPSTTTGSTAPTSTVPSRLAELRARKTCRSPVPGAPAASASNAAATQSNKAQGNTTISRAVRRFEDDERAIFDSAEKVRGDTLAIDPTARYVTVLALVAVCAVVVAVVALGV